AAAFPLMFPNMIVACHPGALRLAACLSLASALARCRCVNFGLAFLSALPLAPVCLLAAGPTDCRQSFGSASAPSPWRLLRQSACC
ncbi:hypothetical protein BOX15_Mlig002558g1, partial [Macrostomum lignano]